MDVEKALLLEEIVDRLADLIAHAAMAPNVLVRGRRVGDGAQNTRTSPLLLHGIRRVGAAVDVDLRRLDLGGLPLRRRLQHFALDADAGAGRQVLDLRFVVRQRRLGDDLDVAQAGAVVEFEEAEAALGVAAGADPALQDDVFADGILAPSLGHGCPNHRSISATNGGEPASFRGPIAFRLNCISDMLAEVTL